MKKSWTSPQEDRILDNSSLLDESLDWNARVLSGGTGTAVATDDGLGNAIWDYGEDDDMTMDMVTDINDGDVDEEVNSVSLSLTYLLMSY